MDLVPLVERLDVDAAHGLPVGEEGPDEVTADEPAGSGDDGVHRAHAFCSFRSGSAARDFENRPLRGSGGSS